MEEQKKSIVMIALVVVIVLAAGLIAITRPPTVPLATPLVQSPVMRVVVSRECDFITIANVTTALCTDETEWKVTEVVAAKPNLLGLGAQPVLAAEPINLAQPILDEIAAAEAPTNYEIEAIERDDPVVIAAATTEQAFTEGNDYISMNIRYSHYWPPLGGPNCATFVGGKCISKMANGQPWEKYVDIAVACPPEWAFGRKVIFEGNTYTCMDRGGKIKYVEGIPWIDFLTPKAAYPYGSVITVQISK